MCRASHPPQRARLNCCRKRTCSAGERSMTIREGTAGTRTTPKGGTSRCSKRPVRCATTHPITVRCSMWNDLDNSLAAEQGCGGVPERHGGPMDHLSCAAVQDFAAALLIGGTQSQPTGELLLTGKGVQIRTYFGYYGLRCQNIDAVDLRPVDSRNAI